MIAVYLELFEPPELSQLDSFRAARIRSFVHHCHPREATLKGKYNGHDTVEKQDQQEVSPSLKVVRLGITGHSKMQSIRWMDSSNVAPISKGWRSVAKGSLTSLLSVKKSSADAEMKFY